jgi:hypothetical protein
MPNNINLQMDDAILCHDINKFTEIFNNPNYNPKNKNYSHFRLAIQEEFTKAVYLFIDCVDVNVNNGEPLIKSIINGNRHLCLLLLEHKDIKPEIFSNHILELTLNLCKFDIAKKLLNFTEVQKSLTTSFISKLKIKEAIDFSNKIKLEYTINKF